MADEVDRAADVVERFTSGALDRCRRRAEAQADLHRVVRPAVCRGCGEPIPLARREAVKGTDRCRPCAERLERGR
jgi:RNA polymerase-binding transcription factor DksA